MEIRTSVQYPADIATILPVLMDPEYARFRLAEAGLTATSVTVSEENGATRLTMVIPVSGDVVPANYRKLVPANLTATIVELWHPTAGDRSPTGVMSVDFTGVPARARANFRLTETGETCERVIEGEVTVSIPLVGKKIEAKAVSMLERLVRAESKAAADYLAR